jgi:hypothetical protein
LEGDKKMAMKKKVIGRLVSCCIMLSKPLCILALAFVILVGPASSQRVDYSGYTEYDGRPATLALTFNGPAVTGDLFVSPVCEQGMHLTGVDIDLVGTATGPWENTATTIAGNWNGGDTDPCDSSKIIKNDPQYPNNGTFTISMIKTDDGKDAVRLVRMPTGYGYIFESKGVVYAGGGGGVDLKIVNLTVPTGIVPGMRAEILVTFINDGTAAAGPFKLYGYAFSKQNYNRMYNSDPVLIPGLQAGELQSITLGISIPSNAPGGPYDVKVAIDNANFAGTGDVIETNENNNEKWKRNVLEPEGPSTGSYVDLVVSDVREDPNQVTTESDNLTFLMDLKNVGTAPAHGFYVGFYLSPNQSITTDDIYIGYGIVDLEPGESKSGPVRCRIPAGILPGLYYIGVIADPQEKVAESDETNNARATDEPVPIPRSLLILSTSNETLASPGSETEVVYLQKGQMHTFQMPDAKYASKIRFDEAGIISLTHWFEHDNFVTWGPPGVLSGDGEETLGSGISITLTAIKEGTANVRMSTFWESKRSNGEVGHGYQDYSWTVIIGSSGGTQDESKPSSSQIPATKGAITNGTIRGTVIYRPTGEPVTEALILSLDYEDEASGGYPICMPNSDELLKTRSDGTFEIDIATWMPFGVDPGTFWIRIIKPYNGSLVQETWETTCLDLWVVQSPLKTFTLTTEKAQAGPIDVGVIQMDKASSTVPGVECPIDSSTGLPIDDPDWP